MQLAMPGVSSCILCCAGSYQAGGGIGATTSDSGGGPATSDLDDLDAMLPACSSVRCPPPWQHWSNVHAPLTRELPAASAGGGSGAPTSNSDGGPAASDLDDLDAMLANASDHFTLPESAVRKVGAAARPRYSGGW